MSEHFLWTKINEGIKVDSNKYIYKQIIFFILWKKNQNHAKITICESQTEFR